MQVLCVEWRIVVTHVRQFTKRNAWAIVVGTLACLSLGATSLSQEEFTPMGTSAVATDSRVERRAHNVVAVCITTMDRPWRLAECLRAITASTIAPDQVIVSDDGPDDATRRANAEAALRSGLKCQYMRGPGLGLCANRNWCVDHVAANVDAIVIIDDDVVLRPEFIARGLDLLRECGPKTIITGCQCNDGTVVPPHNADFFGFEKLPVTSQTCHTLTPNATIFPAEVFRRVKFDPVLRFGHEETDFARRAEAAGYRVQWFPDLVNDHYPDNHGSYKEWGEPARMYVAAQRAHERGGVVLETLYWALAVPRVVLSYTKRLGLPGTRLAFGYVQRAVTMRRSTVDTSA
jgi:GT2 family glycosyltransferase